MPDRLSNLWQELKRRKVIHVIVVYASAAFVIIELSNNITEPLSLPEWTPTFVIVLLSIGFPLAIIFSWIYDISSKGIVKTEKATPDARPARYENSIAVLPFQDMSPGKDQEYFCDGITEEIINALTHVRSLKVIARTSAFAFKNQNLDMREIGEKLNVETLLEGSIRKDSDRIRVTAQLIKAEDGIHLWSERFDRKLEDVFAIQDEISLAIVDNLKVSLLGEEKQAVLKRNTENLETYDLILQAYYWIRMGTAEGWAKSKAACEELIKKEPGNPIGYAGLAYILILGTIFGTIPPRESFPKAEELFLTALKIDPTRGETHAGLGNIELFYKWNWDAAEIRFKKALELNPNSPEIVNTYSVFLRFYKRFDKAIEQANRVKELDPLSVPYNLDIADTYFYAHRIDESIEMYRSIVSVAPDYATAHMELGHAYEAKSMYKEAIEEYRQCLRLSPGIPIVVSELACACYLNGDREEAEELYQSLIKRSFNEFISPFTIYAYHMVCEDYDQAYEWLVRAIEEKDYFLLYMNLCPTKGHRLPDEPRFRKLWTEAGLDVK